MQANAKRFPNCLEKAFLYRFFQFYPRRGYLHFAFCIQHFAFEDKRSFIVICQHRKESQEALRFGGIAAFFVGFLSISQFEKTYKLFLQTKFRFSLSGQKLFSLPDNVKFFPFFSALFPLSDSCISVVHNAIITARFRFPFQKQIHKPHKSKIKNKARYSFDDCVR